MKKISLLLVITMVLSTFSFFATATAAEEDPMELVFIDRFSASWETTPLLTHLEEMFNVKITRRAVSSAEGATYYSLMIAAGDTPEYMVDIPPADYVNYARQGVFAEVPVELVETTAPDMYRWLLDEGGANVFAYGDVDGTNYGIPILWSLTNHWRSLAIRGDWVLEAGIDKMPTTLDELEATMEAVKASRDDITYLITGEGSTQCVSFVAGAYNVFFTRFYEDENGELCWGSFHKNAPAALARLNDWYNKEYIDPEFITNTYDMVFDRWTNGKLFMVQSYWPDFVSSLAWAGSDNNLKNALLAKDPGAQVVEIGPVPGPEGYVGIPGSNPHNGYFTFSADLPIDVISKYIEIFNYCSMNFSTLELAMKGVEGVHFTKDADSNYVWLPPYDEASERDAIGIGVNYPGNFNNYTIQYPFFTNPAGEEERREAEEKNVNVVDIMAPFYREVWSEYNASFVDFCNKNVIDFIVGNRPLSEYDAFVEEAMNSYHGAEIMAEAEALFENLK